MDYEHDFSHVEYVQCIKCGLIVDCYDYYNNDGDKSYRTHECKEVKNA
jgi:hypothetical protein